MTKKEEKSLGENIIISFSLYDKSHSKPQNPQKFKSNPNSDV